MPKVNSRIKTKVETKISWQFPMLKNTIMP